MGTTKDVQIAYWNKLKDSKYNDNLSMPKWYILSITLVSEPNFEDLSNLSNRLIEEFNLLYPKLEAEIKSV